MILRFPFRHQQTRIGRRAIECILSIYSIGACGLFIQAQSSPTLPKAELEFVAEMNGGSKGVPTHLPGVLYVSTGRIEFQAFPQVEYSVWSCKKIGHFSFTREKVMLAAGGEKYKLSLRSAQQVTAFIEAVHSACSDGSAAMDKPTKSLLP